MATGHTEARVLKNLRVHLVPLCLRGYKALVNRPEPAGLDAGFALGALVRVDGRRLPLFPCDRSGRAGLEA